MDVRIMDIEFIAHKYPISGSVFFNVVVFLEILHYDLSILLEEFILFLKI